MRVESGPARGDVWRVAQKMRAHDFAELDAVAHTDGRDALAQALAGSAGVRRDTIVVYGENGEPIVVGGIRLARPNVGTLWLFATDDFPKVALGLTRWLKNELFPRYRAAGVHRLECASIEGYEANHRWLEVLGLRREAVMPGFGKNGETFHQFAWVKS